MHYTPLAIAAVSLGLASGASAQNLLVAESFDDRVLLLDAFDGSVINDTFIDIGAAASSVGYTGGLTPIEALQVGNEVWVSDQVADRIWRFNSNGSFAGQIGVDPMTGEGLLNNARGFEVVGNTAYVAQGSDGAQPEGIVTIDTMTGSITGSFNPLDPGDSSFYDVRQIGNELFVTNADSGNDAIMRFALDGSFLGDFATSDGDSSFDFAQQLSVRDSNGNILVGGFSTPSGVYEFLSDGTSLGVLAGTEDLGPRAAFELGNGDVLFSHGLVLNRVNAGPVIEGSVDDGFFPSFRYINPTNVPAPGAAVALAGFAGLSLRRRR